MCEVFSMSLLSGKAHTRCIVGGPIQATAHKAVIQQFGHSWPGIEQQFQCARGRCR